MLSLDRIRARLEQAGRDGFGAILSLPQVPLVVETETGTDAGKRFRRFAVQLPVRYRLSTEARWQRGVTRNISHFGLLFVADLPSDSSADVSRGNPIEIQVEISPAGSRRDPLVITCDGRVVRTQTLVDRTRRQLSVAAAVRTFRLPSGAAPRPDASPPNRPPAPGTRARRTTIAPAERLPAELAPERRGGGSTTGDVVSLGLNGAFIEVGDSYEVGSRVSVRIRLAPDASEIICWAVVRHAVRGRGIGIEFLDLADAAREQLRVFIERRGSHG